jgi:hypothetical protein
MPEQEIQLLGLQVVWAMKVLHHSRKEERASSAA